MIVTVFFTPVRTILGRFFASSLHQRLVAFHAKDALRGPCILEVFDLLLAVPTSKARRAEGLVAGEDGKILDLVPTCTAAVGAVVADEGAVTEEEQVGVRVEKGQARVAAEAVNVPSIARQFKRFPLLQDLAAAFARKCRLILFQGRVRKPR